jgi:hypothetical protein
MDGWALWCDAAVTQLADALRETLGAQSTVRVVPGHTGRAAIARVWACETGALLIIYEPPNPALARSIAQRIGSATQYLELRLEDTEVYATRYVPAGGAGEDLEETAREILHDWYDGDPKKYLSESYDGLVEALLDLDGNATDTEADHTIWYEPNVSSRVAVLLRDLRNGGRWERTTIAGQAAIRVSGPSGTHISVLSPAEEAELFAALET